MAEVPTITVSVEAAIHQALRDSLQKIYDEHGVLVRRAHIDWVDMTCHGTGPRHVVERVELDTSKAFPLSA